VNHPLPLDSGLAELELKQWHRWAAWDRFPLYAGLMIIGAFLAGMILSNIEWPGSKSYEVSANIGPMPVVEPLLLKAVDKETAKKANDAMPLTQSAVPPALPFIFSGTPADFERATDCLAATIYYEAGAEIAAGQMAAAQVVLNRARHPAYPKTVCGVVFQGHERRTGCQFSYTCDGSMIRRRPSADAWARHRGLAAAMLKGLVYPKVGLATHYHTDWVLPAWSARLDKVRVEGTHLFFRYHGYWGSPAAFKGKSGLTEPSYAKMKALSPAHGGAKPDELVEEGKLTPEEEALVAAEAIPAADLSRVSTSLEETDKGKEVFMIYVDPLLDSGALTQMAENACGGKKTCKVFAWADQGLMPRGLPLEPSEQASMAYRYIRSGSAKSSKQHWNCALFPRDSKGQCL
jgi:spore germination cell wall hydrolase CwlJ-like protein